MDCKKQLLKDYPILNDANPYILEKVLNIITFLLFLKSFSPEA